MHDIGPHEGTLEATDEEIMKEMPLEVIVTELRRRNFPVIYANNLGMIGRIVFIPIALEVIRANRQKAQQGQKIRERNATQPQAQTGMGSEEQRQVYNGMESKGSDTSFGRISTGSSVSWHAPSPTVRVQGSDGDEHRVSETPFSSTTRTPSV